MANVSIADYGLLSDRHSAALVSRDGSVDWLCFPRFDSPSVFARLLDGDGGHFALRPHGEYEVVRHYSDRTMVLDTEFRTPTGVVTLRDALLVGPGNGGHRLGIGVPHMLARQLRCTEGSVSVEVEYHPRMQYGRADSALTTVDGGLSCADADGRMVLTSPVPLTPVTDGAGRPAARGTADLVAGDTLVFAVQWAAWHDPEPKVWQRGTLAAWLADTCRAWQSWSAEHQAYEGPWQDLVHHSGRVLEALSYQPSGAIVAAATTSLPEGVGGERNWDYRYSWVRDASLTMLALWVAACPDEAGDFFSFLTAAAPTVSHNDGMQIMFGVGGEQRLDEERLPHLAGWRDSRPVRIGNDAYLQRQIDVYGELLTAAHRLVDSVPLIGADVREFLLACADGAARHWREPDQGVWEMRGRPQHFVYSKVMCWAALDRAIALADRLEATDRVPGWRATRDEIRRTVLAEGWNADVGAFTQSFGSAELDAAVLALPLVGFLPADDPRMVATVDAIATRLTDPHGLVYRYRAAGNGSASDVDDLRGTEGPFLLCTFQLAEVFALGGRIEQARETFERAAAYVNDLGLLAEEVDPDTGELLGNFPQAFSHIGLVNAAWTISEVEAGRGPRERASRGGWMTT